MHTARKEAREGGQLHGILMGWPLVPGIPSQSPNSINMIDKSRLVRQTRRQDERCLPVPVGLVPAVTPKSNTRLGSTPPAGVAAVGGGEVAGGAAVEGEAAGAVVVAGGSWWQ